VSVYSVKLEGMPHRTPSDQELRDLLTKTRFHSQTLASRYSLLRVPPKVRG